MLSLLLMMFAGMFWLFRVVVAICVSTEINIGFPVTNMTVEVIVLFISLVGLFLLVRRNLFGILLYLGSYIYYFGNIVLQAVLNIQSGTTLTMSETTNVLASTVALALAMFVSMDVLIGKGSRGSTSHKKTDWFYKNEELDRQMDERADKNQYKTL
jgi:hypothetical protein